MVSARWVPRNISKQDWHYCIHQGSCFCASIQVTQIFSFTLWLRIRCGGIGGTQKQNCLCSGAISSPLSRKNFRHDVREGKWRWQLLGKQRKETDDLETSSTITGQGYTEILRKLYEAIMKKCSLVKRGVVLLYNNALVHKTHVAQTAIRDCGFEALSHQL